MPEATEYLPLGLALFAGFVAGYAVCLWRWCSAEEAREPDTEPGLRQCLTLTHVPLPPPGATQTRICGASGTSFGIVHDCLRQRCKAPHGKNAPRADTAI